MSYEPRYNVRDRVRDAKAAPFVVCRSCGFHAFLVDAPGYPWTSPLDRLAVLLDSGCTGCPECGADLDFRLPPAATSERVLATGVPERRPTAP